MCFSEPRRFLRAAWLPSTEPVPWSAPAFPQLVRRRPVGSAACCRCRGFTSGTSGGADAAGLLTRLEELLKPPTELHRFEAVGSVLQKGLVEGSLADRIKVLRSLALLGTLPGRPYPIGSQFFVFLEGYADALGALRDGETIADRASELREVLRCFHAAGVGTDRLRLLYDHIELEFPRFEAAGALLPMPDAVKLCHTMLATGQTSAPAITVLLRAALREPLVHIPDDARELQLLKMIEMLLRVDYLHTQEQLPPDVTEYLSVVRSLRYYDRELRRCTALSYQLTFFLRKHGFPSKSKMIGPYPLKVCDPEERINFEPVEDRAWRGGMQEQPPARKRRHLEAVGWRCFEVHASTWQKLSTYENKAAHVRGLLKENDLLAL